MARQPRHVKAVNLALQGGGAHGAFTWGVLDRLFEDDRIWIEAISGTSAGAMNAVVAAQGMYDGQAPGAREALHAFWSAISHAGRLNPIQRSWLDQVTGNWSLDTSPSFAAFDLVNRLTSPYDVNPFNVNPLRDLLGRLVDFGKVRDCKDMGVFVSATNVHTGRVRVFERDEIGLDVVMASACLPDLFQAVEIEGVPYWDGGLMGNPPLFPFFHGSPSDDIVIVQINPITREETPKTARDIANRVNEITFNSALMHELRAIDFVCRLREAGKLGDEYRSMKVHMIEARKRMRPLGASSKLNTEWRFLRHLFDIGRQAAETWLETRFDALGSHSTLDLSEMFSGVSVLPTEPGPTPAAATAATEPPRSGPAPANRASANRP